MADSLRKTAAGVWTNQPDPTTIAEPAGGTTRTTNGQLEQYTDGQWLPIGAAHNAVETTADPLPDAKAFLASTDPESATLAAATPELAGARGLKAQYPGAYDDLSDAELQAKLDAKNTAPAGYHPGVGTSPLRAMLEGGVAGAAEGATSPAGKAAIGGAASLLGPAGVPVAAGTEALAEVLGAHYGNPNAPQTPLEAVSNVGEAAAAPAITSAVGAAAPYVSKVVSALPKKVTGLVGAGVGGYEGYKRGGVPGAVEGALAGGALGAGVPRSMQALRALTAVAPEAGAEATTAAETAIPGPSQVGRWDAGRVTPLSGTQVPSASLDEMLQPLGGRTADRMAGFSPAMVEKLNASKAGLKAATAPTPKLWNPGPTSIAHQPLGPDDVPAFSFQGEAIPPGEPPAVGGTAIPSAEAIPRNAQTDLSATEIERLRRAAAPTFRRVSPTQHPGFVTNRTIPSVYR